MRRKDLHRHRALQPRVLRPVDLPHPAGAHRREELVGTETRAGSERHLFFGPAVQFKTSVSGVGVSSGPTPRRNRRLSPETSNPSRAVRGSMSAARRTFGVDAWNSEPSLTSTAINWRSGVR